jgi:hypothetical protein
MANIEFGNSQVTIISRYYVMNDDGFLLSCNRCGGLCSGKEVIEEFKGLVFKGPLTETGSLCRTISIMIGRNLTILLKKPYSSRGSKLSRRTRAC